MMGQEIQQGTSESLPSQNLRPFIEGQITGNESGTAFITLAQNLKQQFGATFRERHKTQLIHDQQFKTGQLFLVAQHTFFIFGFD